MPGKIANILAIESSCDDTSVAIVRGNLSDDIPQVLAWAVQSQDEVHSKFGGVVPELASRAHLLNLLPCLKKVLHETDLQMEEMDAFAATSEPGLVSCLLIGHTAAKTFSLFYDRPLISCHHIHAHLASVYIRTKPEFPFLAAVVSGGHSSLFRVDHYDQFSQIGQTLDDAIGEAFDKGAKILGFSQFPGGPEIDRAAQTGDPAAYKFGKVQTPDLNMSFSGLKSELQRTIKREGLEVRQSDLAASYQAALIRHLLDKIDLALSRESLKRVVIVGGVARNSELRNKLEQLKASGRIEEWAAPPLEFCTDNAAMVGVLAFRHFKSKNFVGLDSDVKSTSRPKRERRVPQ